MRAAQELLTLLKSSLKASSLMEGRHRSESEMTTSLPDRFPAESRFGDACGAF